MAKSKKKIIMLTGLGVIAVSSIAYLSSWANQPVTNSPPENAVEGVSITKEFVVLNTELYSAMIPSDLSVKTQNNEMHGKTLSQTFLTSNKSTPGSPITDQLAITVGAVPSDGLNGLSDVQFRLQREDTYLQSDKAYPELGATTFIRSEGVYEKSVFWVDSDKYVAVVVSGTPDRIDELNQDLDELINSWEWQIQ